MLSDGNLLAQFAAGVLAGIVLVSAILHSRILTHILLCAACVAIAYVLIDQGVPRFIGYLDSGVAHLSHYEHFTHGLLLGKFTASLFRWRLRAGREWLP